MSVNQQPQELRPIQAATAGTTPAWTLLLQNELQILGHQVNKTHLHQKRKPTEFKLGRRQDEESNAVTVKS